MARILYQIRFEININNHMINASGPPEKNCSLLMVKVNSYNKSEWKFHSCTSEYAVSFQIPIPEMQMYAMKFCIQSNCFSNGILVLESKRCEL